MNSSFRSCPPLGLSLVLAAAALLPACVSVEDERPQPTTHETTVRRESHTTVSPVVPMVPSASSTTTTTTNY